MPYPANNDSLLGALREMKEGFVYDVPATMGLSAGAYQAPIDLLSAGQDNAELCALAEELLENPVALRQFGDRVYELMEKDIRCQREQFGLFRG